jgi:phenylalanyl-tRNA synthetase beta chain
LQATLLADPLPAQLGCADLEREEQARDRLVTLGLQEVITYSLTTAEREAPLNPPAGDYLTLVNPISTERSALRHTLLAGVLDVVAANLKHGDSVSVFEIGCVYLPKGGQKLPEEPRRLALALTGLRTQPFWQDALTKSAAVDFFDLKGLIEALLVDLHVAGVGYRRASAGHLHPGRSAELVLKDRSLGAFGELHPRTARAFDLTDRSVLVAELDLDALLAAMPERFPYEPVPRFPAALRDIAVVVPESITVERVMAEIRAAGSELLGDLRLFDLYRGPSIPEGTKSLAFAIAYQASDRTLAEKEIDKLHKKIEDRLVHVLKASIRGKEEAKK